MANFIVFDVDGTLNSQKWYKTYNLNKQDKDLDPKCIERLNKICSETGAYLIMSSDWRYDFNDACDRLYKAGLTGKIIDKTEMSIFGPKELSRGKEIQNWVDTNLTKNEKWCIIDDRTDILPNQPFFEINPDVGLTDKDVENIIKYFVD